MKNLKSKVISTASAAALTLGVFGTMGATAPAADAGILCSAISNGGLGAYSACKSWSGNNATQVRVVADCGSVNRYGRWVDGRTDRSHISCAVQIDRAWVQIR
ncbi:hypothetical protein O4J56_17255 [Nocardiopsis sp. RSe5-2]|uniref:Uncharacterized protein n=1 Tax=Nocardiopsis endophytica TaxID=3018445 RepID=A0ABT4U626_9ACTN|nr:hypothetical protein [Nocardiopsis endophytica]MDA2812393.1 hypothetical protein [Nocardiopsis endophytica]